MPCCVAVGCSNKDRHGIKLFRFPREEIRRKTWTYKVRRENWQSSELSRLCEVSLNQLSLSLF